MQAEAWLADVFLRQRHFGEDLGSASPGGSHSLEDRTVAKTPLRCAVVEAVGVNLVGVGWRPLSVEQRDSQLAACAHLTTGVLRPRLVLLGSGRS